MTLTNTFFLTLLSPIEASSIRCRIETRIVFTVSYETTAVFFLQFTSDRYGLDDPCGLVVLAREMISL